MRLPDTRSHPASRRRGPHQGAGETLQGQQSVGPKRGVSKPTVYFYIREVQEYNNDRRFTNPSFWWPNSSHPLLPLPMPPPRLLWRACQRDRSSSSRRYLLRIKPELGPAVVGLLINAGVRPLKPHALSPGGPRLPSRVLRLPGRTSRCRSHAGSPPASKPAASPPALGLLARRFGGLLRSSLGSLSTV